MLEPNVKPNLNAKSWNRYLALVVFSNLDRKERDQKVSDFALKYFQDGSPDFDFQVKEFDGRMVKASYPDQIKHMYVNDTLPCVVVTGSMTKEIPAWQVNKMVDKTGSYYNYLFTIASDAFLPQNIMTWGNQGGREFTMEDYNRYLEGHGIDFTEVISETA